MNATKQVRQDLALEQLSLNRVQEQLDQGVIQPSTYLSLPDVEKLYVRKVLFERLSSTAAAKYIAEKVNALGSYQYDAMALEIEYRLNPRIQSAIKEIMAVKDIEFSSILQDKARLAMDVTAHIMLNSKNEELRLKAADSITRAAMTDLTSKRSKTVDIKQTKTETSIKWNIQVANKDNLILPDEQFMDATVQDFAQRPDKKESRDEISINMESNDSMIIPPEADLEEEILDEWDAIEHDQDDEE